MALFGQDNVRTIQWALRLAVGSVRYSLCKRFSCCSLCSRFSSPSNQTSQKWITGRFTNSHFTLVLMWISRQRELTPGGLKWVFAMRSGFACPASHRPKSTIKKKKPTNLCALREFLKQGCRPCLIIIQSCYFDCRQTFHMLDLRLVLCSLDLDVLRVQRSMGFFKS